MSIVAVKKKMVLFPKKSMLFSWNEEKQSLFLKFARQKKKISKQAFCMEKYPAYSNGLKKNCN